MNLQFHMQIYVLFPIYLRSYVKFYPCMSRKRVPNSINRDFCELLTVTLVKRTSNC